MSPKDQADFKTAMSQIDKKGAIQTGSSKGNAFWTAQLKRAMANPQNFFQELQEWGPKVAVLMLPIAALLLTVLFLFKKNVYVFDHLIFSMHSLSFQGLLLTTVFLLGLRVGWADALLWLAPVHLFVHMRGTYGISVVGTLIRMFLLFIGSSIAFAFLMVGLVVVGLATVH
jgi:hypothetical protein